MDFAKPLSLRPAVGERLQLGLRNLYILPSRFGWQWLAVLLILQLVGIQLQSNGPILLSSLMLAVFLLALHLTHFNLQGLEFRCEQPAPGFAATPLTYPLRVRVTSRCEGLRLGWAGQALGRPHTLAPGVHHLAVTWTPQRRGLHTPGLLHLQTSAPLGLFVCWSRWQPSLQQLVFPARQAGPVRELSLENEAAADAPSANAPQGLEGDEWQDLTPHRPEHGHGRLAWKRLAQGRGRFTKRFGDPPGAQALLAPEPSVSRERALEHLSERIWRLHGQGASFGLVLGEQRIPPDRGPEQRDRCLTALATCH
jgi:uncharacterized protein (DUF58 family)